MIRSHRAHRAILSLVPAELTSAKLRVHQCNRPSSSLTKACNPASSSSQYLASSWLPWAICKRTALHSFFYRPSMSWNQAPNVKRTQDSYQHCERPVADGQPGSLVLVYYHLHQALPPVACASWYESSSRYVSGTALCL